MEKSRDMILKVYRNAVAIRAFELADALIVRELERE